MVEGEEGVGLEQGSDPKQMVSGGTHTGMYSGLMAKDLRNNPVKKTNKQTKKTNT